MTQQKRVCLASMRMQVRSLASLSGLRIWCCSELWCMSQTRLRSGVAVVQASGYSSDLPPRLGTSICHRCDPKKKNKKHFSLERLCLRNYLLRISLWLGVKSYLGEVWGEAEPRRLTGREVNRCWHVLWARLMLQHRGMAKSPTPSQKK